MSSFGRTGKTKAHDRVSSRAGWGDAALWALGGVLVLSMPRAVGAGGFLAVTFGLSSLPYVCLILIVFLSCFLSLRVGESGAPASARWKLEDWRCGADGARSGRGWRSALKWSAVACLAFEAYAWARAFLGGYDSAIAWRTEPESRIELALYLFLAFAWCSYTCHRIITFESSRSMVGLRSARHRGCLFASLALAGLALGLLSVAIDGCWLSSDGDAKVAVLLVGGLAGILLAIMVVSGIVLASIDRIDALNCLCVAFGSACISRIGIRISLLHAVMAAHSMDDAWLVPAVTVLALASVFLLAVHARSIAARKGDGFAEESAGGASPSWMDVQGLVLTDRERQVVDMSLRGMTLSNIADELGIALSTAGTYRVRAVEKLGCGSWSEAIRLLQSNTDDPTGDETDCTGHAHDAGREHVALKRALFAIAGIGAVCTAASAVVPETMTACLQVLASFAFVCGILKLTSSWRGPSKGGMESGNDIGPIWLAIMGVSSCMAMSLVVQQGTFGGVLARLSIYVTALFSAIALAAFWGHWGEFELDPGRPCSGKNDERTKSYLEIRGIDGTTRDVLLATCRQESVAMIANELCIAPTTVISCRARGYRKLGVHGKEGLLSLLARELS